MHSNQWNCFILNRSHQMAFFVQRRAKAVQKAGFRVLLKYFEIKKAFCFYIKQIDSMLPCVWFSNRSQKTSKCGKNISDTLGYASCATCLFLPPFDVICDLLLNRCTATWNLFVKLNLSYSCMLHSHLHVHVDNIKLHSYMTLMSILNNLIMFCYGCCLLIGYAIRYLFCCK